MFSYITTPYTSDDIDWEVRVLMGGKSTGNKLIAYLFLCCVRIFFIEYKEGDRVRLLVLGALFKGNMDFLRRTRWIGHLFGRKSTWDKLRLIEIATQEKDKKETDKKIRRKKCSRPPEKPLIDIATQDEDEARRPSMADLIDFSEKEAPVVVENLTPCMPTTYSLMDLVFM
ncbi:hypothetical protein ACP275_01G085000 [Erythranthe tilingii]